MTTRIGNFLYLGNFADIDSDEASASVDNPELFEGLTVTPQVIEITEIDGADDGIIHINNYTSRDDLSYDLVAGQVTTDLDSSTSYDVDILLGDGSTTSKTISIVQFANGDTFAMGNSTLSGLDIQTITINTVNTNYGGYYAENGFIDNVAVVCFAGDTTIATPSGEVPARDLKVGDVVKTRSGPKPIRWMSIAHHDQPGAQAPIILRRHALGENVPHKALRLSPQHRVLIESKWGLEICGHRDVLVSAKSLLPLNSVRQAKPDAPVTYIHIALDTHEILYAHGAPVESFWPGRQALRALSPKSALKLHAAAPRLLDAFAKGRSAAPIIEGKLRKTLVTALATGPARVGAPSAAAQG